MAKMANGNAKQFATISYAIGHWHLNNGSSQLQLPVRT
jgi:hypothetical protein